MLVLKLAVDSEGPAPSEGMTGTVGYAWQVVPLTALLVSKARGRKSGCACDIVSAPRPTRIGAKRCS